MFFKKTYTRFFPITSVRRFILDQIFEWTFIIGCFLGIIMGSIFCFYCIGYLLTYQFPILLTNKKNIVMTGFQLHVTNGATGFCFSFFMVLFGIPVWLGIEDCYTYSYLPWLKSQQKYIKELQEGKLDQEAIYIPVTLTVFQKINYSVFPLGSVRRYLSRLLLYCTFYSVIISIILYFHMHFSLVFINLIGLNDPLIPWAINWLISSLIQVGIFLLGLLFVCVFNFTCYVEWLKFQKKTEEALDKK